MEQGLRLVAELVPSSTWYRNLRSAVTQQTWDRIRRSTYREYGYRCGVCRVRGRLNSHEIWEYDGGMQVQKLSGFIALCDRYHEAKHNLRLSSYALAVSRTSTGAACATPPPQQVAYRSQPNAPQAG